ncbi:MULTISPECIES: NTP transferase domain-containing protein [Halomonadaceae]|uniref:nucleotidyltransferase family protein n=1 Tax=Halomonadaceae TaxID=28256 RepID=UPI00159AEB2F|nr:MULTISPECIES: nucleotidyltransferase family protein [Halomonas]QJQ94678.1 nucleotidyltransferase family protein [Halomonas sp. PA5]
MSCKVDERDVARVVAVIMAAGRSRRFGTADKRMARLPDGRPMLAAVQTLAAEAFDEVRVVLRDDDEVASLSLPTSIGVIRVAMQCDMQEGLGNSLSAAFTALERDASLDDCVAAAVMLADMPALRSETLQALKAMAARGGILRPSHEGASGHPVIFGRRFWQALAGLGGDEGGRSVIRDHCSACRELAVDDAGIHFDIDTQEGLSRLGG